MQSGDNPKPSTPNPFVRFKELVDSTFATILGHPSYPSPPPPQQSSRLSNHTMDPIKSSDENNTLESLLFTSYSPANLRHLPQPVPNDLPEHPTADYDKHIFTFEDAFEDLLLVSQGKPLPSIEYRYGYRSMIRQFYPQGQPFWHWLKRLDGLHDLRYPFHYDQQDNKNSLRGRLEQKSNVWGNDEEWPSSSHDDHGVRSILKDLRDVHGIFQGFFKSLDAPEQKIDQDTFRRNDEDQSSELDAFENLLNHVTSAFDSGQKTWDAFAKAVANANANSNNDNDTINHRQHSEKPKVIESREEHVDKNGYLHSKITRKELDSEGNEIGISTIYNVRPRMSVDDEDWERAEAANNDTGSALYAGGDRDNKGHKSGWFWRKD